MEFSEVLEKRRSVRKFKNKKLDAQQLDKILKAINSAPSAHNAQAYELVIVESPGMRKELSKVCREQEWVEKAPVNIVFCANPSRTGETNPDRARFYALGDAFIACSYAQLAAVDLGLASVWIGAFRRNEVSELLELPSELEPVAVLPIGYAAEEPRKTSRRSVKDLVKKQV